VADAEPQAGGGAVIPHPGARLDFAQMPFPLRMPWASAGEVQPPPAASTSTPPTCQTPSGVRAAARIGVVCWSLTRSAMVGFAAVGR